MVSMSLPINFSKIYAKKNGDVSVSMGFKMQGWQKKHINWKNICVYSCSALKNIFAEFFGHLVLNIISLINLIFTGLLSFLQWENPVTKWLNSSTFIF